MTALPRLDGSSIVVSDMAASLAFYRACGLAIPDDVDDHPHVDVPVADGFRLMFDTIDTVRSFDPGWSAPAGGHRFTLAFACDTPADVDAAHARLIALGYRSHHEPFDAFWGQHYAAVLDPDGAPVDFYAPLLPTPGGR
ncbi:VOC family protein [Gordonia jinhuaensis]|uniref:Glyoxalase n=1 Tax=Gordonia jinhuaensis TaxID=1517702 RepID=A0A916SYD9_9ACTN|nr:VOC family protein [Gordonia jinhuaensis]GGB23509.1 glyoxalase [Gordonia jinhuaensis]